MGMYYPPIRPDEIYHWGIEKGKESKSHKYFNRIQTGVKNGQNIYRYFYDKASWDAFNNKKQQTVSNDQKSSLGRAEYGMHHRKVDFFKKLLFGVVGSQVKQAIDNAMTPEDDVESWDDKLSKPKKEEPKKPEVIHEDGSVENPTGEKEYKYIARIPLSDGTFRYFYDEESYRAYLNSNETEESHLLNTFELKKEPTTPEEDMTEINEKYPLGPEYQNNCWSCSISYEMRRRGFDVEAIPSERGETTDEVLSHWKESNKDYKEITNMELDDASRIFKESCKQEGNGARGILLVLWDGGGGHAVNWEVENGEVIIRDSQVNKIYRGSEVDDFLSWSDLNNPNPIRQRIYQETNEAPVGWFRTDNLNINDLDSMRRSTNRN